MSNNDIKLFNGFQTECGITLTNIDNNNNKKEYNTFTGHNFRNVPASYYQ